MKLYVANCTKQIRDFAYRVPEEPGLRRQTIPIGQQIALSGDLNSLQIDAIIRQLQRYGHTNAEDIKNIRTYVGICYSVGKPVPLGTIMLALEKNQSILIRRGRDMREMAAVSSSNLIESHLAENQLATLEKFDVTIEEEARKGATGDEGPAVNEALRVSRSTIPDAPAPERRRAPKTGKKAA